MKSGLVTFGSLSTAFLSSACCTVPIAFSILGIGGAGFFVLFEQYRPYFLSLTVIMLGLSFYFTYRAPNTSDEECADCVPEQKLNMNKINKIALWTTTIVVIFLMVFPNFVSYL